VSESWSTHDVCRQKLRPYLDTSGQIKNEFARCLMAEFFGTLLFQMFGGSAPAKDTTAPAANGFALVAVGKPDPHPNSWLMGYCKNACMRCA
jgi:hypothetical protein